MNTEHHDHTQHHRMMIRDFKKRFYITIVLSIPVLALSELIQQFLGFSLQTAGDSILVFVFAAVIFVYGGWPFLKGLAAASGRVLEIGSVPAYSPLEYSRT